MYADLVFPRINKTLIHSLIHELQRIAFMTHFQYIYFDIYTECVSLDFPNLPYPAKNNFHQQGGNKF